MNVYRQELRAFASSSLCWIAVLAAVTVGFLCIYPSVEADVGSFSRLLQGFAAPIREALGLDLAMMSSVLGFYGFLFIYLGICGSVQAMMLGASVVARDRRCKTFDFLLSKPVSRRAALTAKLAAALTWIALSSAVFIAVSAAACAAVQGHSGLDWVMFRRIAACMPLLQLYFAALGLCLAVVAYRIKSPLPVSLGVVLGLYLVGAVGMLVSDDKLRLLSPFRYYDPARLLTNGALDMKLVVVGLCLTAAFIAVAYAVYCRRDVHAA